MSGKFAASPELNKKKNKKTKKQNTNSKEPCLGHVGQRAANAVRAERGRAVGGHDKEQRVHGRREGREVEGKLGHVWFGGA